MQIFILDSVPHVPELFLRVKKRLRAGREIDALMSEAVTTNAELSRRRLEQLRQVRDVEGAITL